MNNKNFKTIQEQIQILRERGLTINDADKAEKILIRENYFFLVGYRYIFLENGNKDKYVEGSTFEELYALFCFDRFFRNILFKNLLIVENNMKSIFSYQLSKKYGYRESEYLKPESFTSDKRKFNQINDVINKMKRQIRNNCLKHSATAHYVNKYGYIPLWILVKVLSFGMIADLFYVLKSSDKEAISNHYNLDVKTLEKYLSMLSNYRNLCAHEDIVYDNKTEKIIPDTSYHSILNLKKEDDEYVCGKNDIYSVIIMLKILLSEDEFNVMLNEIDYELKSLDLKITSVSLDKVLDRMGFSRNWKDIKNI